jgi:hypothetical protein
LTALAVTNTLAVIVPAVVLLNDKPITVVCVLADAVTMTLPVVPMFFVKYLVNVFVAIVLS